MIVKFLATLFLLASIATGQNVAYGGLNANVTAADAYDQAGFYIFGDKVSANGRATEFCAIGKVNTESYQGAPNATIAGRVIFFVVRARAADEDTESGDSEDEMVQEYSIVGREAVTYRARRRRLQNNVVKSCASADMNIQVEKGDLIGVFIHSACNTGNICPLQVNFIGDGGYGVRFFNDSDTVSSNRLLNDDFESDVLQNPLILIDKIFLNVQVTIETGDIEGVITDYIEDGTENVMIETETTKDVGLEETSSAMLVTATVVPVVIVGFTIVVIVVAVVILYMYKSTKKTFVPQERRLSHYLTWTWTVENGNSRGENGEWSDKLPGATPHKNTQPVGTDTEASNENYYLLSAPPTPYEEPVSLQEEEEEHDYEEPYFEPASEEDDLLQQLKKLYIPVIEQEKELQNLECLGSGTFGIVHRGVWSHSVDDKIVEEEVAVKTMENGANEEDRVKFLQEAAIMGQFNHPNIVRLLGIMTSPEPLKIVIELMKRGDLRKHLSHIKPDPGAPVSPELAPTLLSYSRQVTNGMMYLGVKSFVHRDLAARNILVSEDGVCKIADFGLSRDLQNGDYYVSHGGKIPVKWTAPEALHYRKYSTASDVWSYGCVLYEIWSLAHKPFHNDTNAEAMKKINTGFRLAPPPGCPRAIYQIMIQCWNPEVDGRPAFLDITIPLQKPDFQILKWSSEDMKVCSEKTRTLGTPLKHGLHLHKDLQRTYLTTNMTHQVKTDTRSTNEGRNNYEHEDEMAKEKYDSCKVVELDSKSIGDHHYEQDPQGENAGTSLESSDHYGQEDNQMENGSSIPKLNSMNYVTGISELNMIPLCQTT